MKKNIYLSLVMLFLCQIISARTLYVEKTGNDMNDGTSQVSAFLSVEKAFLHLMDGDVVSIGEGIFTINKTLEWGNKSITIQGAGKDKTIIQASENMIKDLTSVYTYSVFHYMVTDGCESQPSESTISDLTIRNGAAPITEIMPTGVGGGIRNFSKLNLKNCVLENNVALNGGAIYNDGTLSIENVIIRNNHAFNAEGAIFNTPKATILKAGTNVIENNTQDDLYNTSFVVNDFESGFVGKNGTNGNGDGGYIENNVNFMIVDNPNPIGINTTAKVGKFKRLKNGNWWAYAWFEFPNHDVQVVPCYLHMMVYKPIASRVCIQVKDRHADPTANTGEILSDAQTAVNEWQDIVFEISNTGNYCYIEIKPDFVNQAPNTRLTDDIEIYFDEIIIDGSPTPREPKNDKIGGFDFPKDNASLSPTNTADNLLLSDLTYSNSLTYDYNPTNGYFRPYGWPTGEVDDSKYLEFKLQPLSGVQVEITKLEMAHRPNTNILGPSKVKIAYSIDNTSTFTSLPEISFTAPRTNFTTSVVEIGGLKTTQTVTFRLYAYESLHGTAAQKDFWIIDYMNVYGGIIDNPTSIQGEDQEEINAFVSQDILYIHGIDRQTKVDVYDLMGRLISDSILHSDGQIMLNRASSVFVIKLSSETHNNVIKVFGDKE